MAGRKVESVSNLTSKSIGTWITVRVVYKSNLISCKNGKKQLRLHLTDASGTISAVAYAGEAEQFFEKFEIEKVYSICGFNIDRAKKQFTHLEHDYEITLNFKCTIKLHENDSCVPGISYNFVTIADIANMAPNQKVDCIAVCRDSHLTTGIAKNNKGYHKRVLQLFDNSNASIDLKLWGEDACRLDNQPPFIVAIKGAIIDVYNESISLNMSKGSTIKIDPDLLESHSLRKCLDPEHCDSLLCRNGNIQRGSFSIKGTIYCIDCKHLYYIACEGCNKKATMGNDGSYCCENCQTSPNNNVKYQLMLKMFIGTPFAELEVVGFNEFVTNILGRSAKDIVTALEKDPSNAEEIYKPIYYQTYIFNLASSRKRSHEGVLVNNITVKSAKPVHYKSYNKYLINDLKKFISIE